MIKLINDWVIEADERNYKLGILKPIKNKNGEMEQKLFNITYHNTVSDCIKACLTKEQRNLVTRDTLTLKEAVQAFTELKTTFDELVKECIN